MSVNSQTCILSVIAAEAVQAGHTQCAKQPAAVTILTVVASSCVYSCRCSKLGRPLTQGQTAWPHTYKIKNKADIPTTTGSASKALLLAVMLASVRSMMSPSKVSLAVRSMQPPAYTCSIIIKIKNNPNTYSWTVNKSGPVNLLSVHWNNLFNKKSNHTVS